MKNRLVLSSCWMVVTVFLHGSSPVIALADSRIAGRQLRRWTFLNNGILGHKDDSSSYGQSSSSSNGSSYAVGSVGSVSTRQQQSNNDGASSVYEQYSSNSAGEQETTGDSANGDSVAKTSYLDTEQQSQSSSKGWSSQPHDTKIAVVILLVVLVTLLIGLGFLVRSQVAVVRELHNGFLSSVVAKSLEKTSPSTDEETANSDLSSVDTTAAELPTTTHFISMDSIIRTAGHIVTTEVSGEGVECHSTVTAHSAV